MIRNFMWFGLGNGLALVLTFATQMYLARVLQPEAFGQLAYAMTWCNYLALVADFGVSTYGMREVAQQRDRATIHVRSFLSMRFFISVVLLAGFSAAVWAWPAAEDTKILLVAYVSILLPRALAVDWALQGLERMPLSGLSRAAATALPLAGYLVWVRGAPDVLLVPLLGFAGALATHVAFLAGLGWVPRRALPGRGELASFARRASAFWLLTAGGSLMWGTAETIVLNRYGNEEDVAYYSLAFRTMSVIQVVVAWLGSTVLPSLSHLVGAKDPHAFRTETRRFARLSLALGFGLAALGWLLARPAFTLVFGSSYEPAVPLFRTLLILVVLTGINGPFMQPLLALGHERHALLVVLLNAVIHVALCFGLIPTAGARGAAWVSVVSYAIGTLLIILLYKMKMRGASSRETGAETPLRVQPWEESK